MEWSNIVSETSKGLLPMLLSLMESVGFIDRYCINESNCRSVDSEVYKK